MENKITPKQALKDLEEKAKLLICNDGYVCDLVKPIYQALDEREELKKVLEIIKEKSCSHIEKVLIVSCNDYEEYCFEMNSGRVYSSEYECKTAFKTPEEYDLLKGWLTDGK